MTLLNLYIAPFDVPLKASLWGYDKYDMSNYMYAGAIRRLSAWSHRFGTQFLLVGLVLLCAFALACTKQREQPQLQSGGAAAASNSLRAPVYDPLAKPDKVGLRSRKWGANAAAPGSMGRPLTNGNNAIAAAQSKTLNDDANGLKRAELQKALDEKMGGLAKCFDNSDVTSVGVYFEADPSGEAKGIRVRGAPGEAEACARGIIGQLRFPEFQGNPVPVDFPISISRRVQTVTKTADSPEGTPTNQFVNP